MPKRTERYQYPHTAIIKFHIGVHKVVEDNNLEDVGLSSHSPEGLRLEKKS